MKKIILLLAFLFIFSGFSTPASAKSEFFAPVCVKVNGEYVKTKNNAYLKKGVTNVSIRDIGEIFGAEIFWNEKTSTAELKSGAAHILVTKGSSVATLNNKTVKLSHPVVIVNDRVYVPLRFISEAFGAEVSWDPDTLTANITAKNAFVPAHLKGKAPYTEDELYWLSRIVSSEAQGEINRGKVAVANVVLNRVKSNQFPNTIYGVIFDTQYGVQFTPVSNGTIFNIPTADSVTAAKRALLGEDISRQCLFFLNPKTATNSWIAKNRTFYKKIGNHDFYL